MQLAKHRHHRCDFEKVLSPCIETPRLKLSGGCTEEQTYTGLFHVATSILHLEVVAIHHLVLCTPTQNIMLITLSKQTLLVVGQYHNLSISVFLHLQLDSPRCQHYPLCFATWQYQTHGPNWPCGFPHSIFSPKSTLVPGLM